jgi:glycosyltransferase involved in cell wall biosynthesis
VFIGRLCAEKGVREAVEAAETLGGEASLDVYGPFWGDSLSEDIFHGKTRVRYRGPIEPDRVPDVMREHDALLLPTRHRDEGYPGGIIEAFAAGRPVICTRWMALPEMVDDSCGILIEPGDAAGLSAAMKRLTDDPMLYNRLCEGAWIRRMNYSSVAWTERFVKICRRLARGPRETP